MSKSNGKRCGKVMLPKFARIQKPLTIMVQTLKLVKLPFKYIQKLYLQPDPELHDKVYMHEGNLEHEIHSH